MHFYIDTLCSIETLYSVILSRSQNRTLNQIVLSLISTIAYFSCWSVSTSIRSSYCVTIVSLSRVASSHLVIVASVETIFLVSFTDVRLWDYLIKNNQKENSKNLFLLFFYPLRLGGSLLTLVAMHQPKGLPPPSFSVRKSGKRWRKHGTFPIFYDLRGNCVNSATCQSIRGCLANPALESSVTNIFTEVVIFDSSKSNNKFSVCWI